MPRIRVCASSELREREGVRFRLEGEGGAVEAFAVRFQGELRAYVNVCTHRAMELDLGEGVFFADDGQRLACRAHGALYDPLRGDCVGGICQRGARLTPIEVTEEGGAIWAGEPG